MREGAEKAGAAEGKKRRNGWPKGREKLERYVQRVPGAREDQG